MGKAAHDLGTDTAGWEKFRARVSPAIAPPGQARHGVRRRPDAELLEPRRSVLYEQGVGVPQDLAKAALLHERACDGGIPEACG